MIQAITPITQQTEGDIIMNETVNNINTANFELKMESVEFKGITLKGLSVSGHADFSDEKVKMETEGAVSILKALFAFADAKLDRVIEHAIEADNKRAELRQKEFERETEILLKKEEREKEYFNERVAAKKAECEYWKVRTASVRKEEEGDAEK